LQKSTVGDDPTVRNSLDTLVPKVGK
jgi:hypothetical protein